MLALTGRAVIVSASRLANYGLLIVSPILLARLLSVEQFGRYREFLVYATLLHAFTTLSVNSSLLYFVPAQRAKTWRFVHQCVLMVGAASLLTVTGTALVDLASGGALLGGYLVPLVIYVLAYSNFDFWGFLWLAQKRVGRVFALTTGRLAARITTVVVAAALTHDVQVVIWSLVAYESLRLLVAAIAWLRVAPPQAPGPDREAWREQLRYCWPIAGTTIVVTFNQQLGHLFVLKALGPAALALYAIGTYVQPIINVFRNSVSDVLLSEMSERSARSEQPALLLWQRSVILFLMVLLPAGILLARHAEPIVVLLFSDAYRGAAPIFQVYLLVLLRECFDFAVLLRSVNRTGQILWSNLLMIGVNLALLFALVPLTGPLGAVAALVVSRFVEAVYLGRRAAEVLEVPVARLLPWSAVARVCAAAALASGVFLPGIVAGESGGAEGALASVVFALLFLLLLWLLRVPEARTLIEIARRTGAGALGSRG